MVPSRIWCDSRCLFHQDVQLCTWLSLSELVGTVQHWAEQVTWAIIHTLLKASISMSICHIDRATITYIFTCVIIYDLSELLAFLCEHNAYRWQKLRDEAHSVITYRYRWTRKIRNQVAVLVLQIQQSRLQSQSPTTLHSRQLLSPPPLCCRNHWPVNHISHTV